MKTSQRLFIYCLPLLLFASSPARAINLCEPSGYAIGFFNGVRTTFATAVTSATALRDSSVGTTYKNEPVTYEVFYNQAGATDGATFMQDFAEVFIQREAELDGALQNRWDIFWEVLSAPVDQGDFISNITTRASAADAQLSSLLSGLYTSFMTTSVAGWSMLLSNPPTAVDYATQQSRVLGLSAEGKKVLLVAHSQGNLFVNQAYDAAMTFTDANSVKVVHVAPASPTVRGPHVLADIDLVINALRAQGIYTVQPVTVQIPATHLITDDSTGHGFVTTYLNAKRDALPQVVGQVHAALDGLVPPRAHGGPGIFTVSMSWDGPGIATLDAEAPNTESMCGRPNCVRDYWADTTGDMIDVAPSYAPGPYHFRSTCQSDKIQLGYYVFGVRTWWNETDHRRVTVSVSTNTETWSRSYAIQNSLQSPSFGWAPVSVLVEKDANGNITTKVVPCEEHPRSECVK